MSWGDAAVHWLHVTAAVLWVGGTFCLSLVVQPVLRRHLEEKERRVVYRALGEKLILLQWGTWLVLLTTGVWKIRRIESIEGVLAVKLALAAAMTVLSLLHSHVWGPALAAESLDADRRAVLAGRAAFWGRINALLLLAVLFCGVVLTARPA